MYCMSRAARMRSRRTGGFLGFFVLRQFLVLHRRNLDVQVDAVEQRTGDSRQVSLDQRRRTGALVQRISVIPALTGIHRGREHEARREGQGHGRAGDRHFTVLKRLAQNVQHMAVEFRQFVEEQDAIVSKTDFTGPRQLPRRSDLHQKWCGAEHGKDA